MIQKIAILLISVWLYMPLVYGAAETGAAPVKSSQASVAESAELVLFNRPVFTFRSDNQGIAPADRVKRARARIQEQLTLSGTHAVSLRADSAGVQVQIDGVTSFIILPRDLDPGREDSLEEVSRAAAAALTLAISESVESRNLETMLWALSKALGATAVYGVLLWLGSRARRALSQWLVTVTALHTSKLQVGGVVLIQRERIATAVQWAIALVYRLVVLVITVEWLSFALRCFPLSRAWGESLSSYLLALVMPLFAAALGAVPELLTALLIFYIGYLTSRAVDRFFTNVQSGQMQIHWLDADVAVSSRRITKVVVWLFTLAMAYPYLPGSGTEAFKGLSVLVGLMLSLGASSLVGQAASGLILTYGRAFRKGEFVGVAGQEGTVTEMGIFTTRIRTGLGEELTISNASILGSTTRNYSRAVHGTGFVLDTTVTIGYDTPWRQVHAMLIEAALRTAGVLRDPPPSVFQTSLSDWYPAYRLVCQAIPEGPMPRALILSTLHGHIQDVFNEYGVQIMSPHYISDPSAPKTVPPEGWYAPPAGQPAELSQPGGNA
jgi:small-conductance mechanosensitive channel